MVAGPSNDDLAQQSRFTFIGEVRRLHAATMPEVPVTDRTVVVRVDSVIHAPEVLGDWTGKEITILVRDPADVQVGQRTVFYTQGWLYGKSIAVQALGYGPVPEAAVGQGVGGTDPVQALIDRDRQARMDSADLVIRGTVMSVRLPAASETLAVARSPVSGKRGRHEPMWLEAVIRVTSVQGGSPPQSNAPQTVEVWFPGSNDVAWHAYPKFQVGQQGQFVLRKTSIDKLVRTPGGGAAATADVYVAAHPLDFQPEHELGEASAGSKSP